MGTENTNDALAILGAVGGAGGIISAMFTAYQHMTHGPDITVDNSWIQNHCLESRFETYANQEEDYRIYDADIPFSVFNKGNSETTLIGAKIEFDYVGDGKENFLNDGLPKPKIEWKNSHSFPVFKAYTAQIRITEFTLWLPYKPNRIPTRAKIKLKLKFLGLNEKQLWYFLDLPTKQAWPCDSGDAPMKTLS